MLYKGTRDDIVQNKVGHDKTKTRHIIEDPCIILPFAHELLAIGVKKIYGEVGTWVHMHRLANAATETMMHDQSPPTGGKYAVSWQHRKRV